MSILSVSPHNFVHPYRFAKNSVPNPMKSHSIAFRGDEDEKGDDEKVKSWCKDFERYLCDKEMPNKDRQKGIDLKLAQLELEKQTVQAKILLEENLNMGTPFDAALVFSPYATSKIWDYVRENASEYIRGNFLMGDFDSVSGTAFFKAAQAKEPEVAKSILDYMATKADKRLSKNFFNLEDSDWQTMEEALIKRGFTDLADKYKEYAQKYKNGDSIEPEDVDNGFNKPKGSPSGGGVAEQGKFRVYENVKTRFADVGGLTHVKKQIDNELLGILKNPKVKNSDKPNGIMLYGPPGTGKTLLATAIAGEAEVPFISTEGSSFAEIYVGAGPRNVRNLYSQARKLAQKHPSKTAIVFIDEVDAVGGARKDGSDSERNSTLNALLCEMDSVRSKEDDSLKIITIMATNRKDMLDKAFRKGRIDMEFKIEDPSRSEAARLDILKIHAKDKPFKNNKERDALLQELAKTTQGFSGAELADVIKIAYRKTLYKGRRVDYITKDDIYNAKIESIFGIKTDLEESEYDYETTLTHEAGHAINHVVLNKILSGEKNLVKQPIRVLDFILNEPHGGAAGITFNKPSDKNSGRYTIESMLSSIAATYGGYSIEEVKYGCHTDGVRSDLENISNRIFTGITEYGLGSKTRFLGLSPNGQVYELYKQDVKNDVTAYADEGMKISRLVCEFAAPFIDEYVAYAKKSPKKIIEGEEFTKMFEDWVIANKKEKDFEKLGEIIRKEMSDFRAKMTNPTSIKNKTKSKKNGEQ